MTIRWAWDGGGNGRRKRRLVFDPPIEGGEYKQSPGSRVDHETKTTPKYEKMSPILGKNWDFEIGKQRQLLVQPKEQGLLGGGRPTFG